MVYHALKLRHISTVGTTPTLTRHLPAEKESRLRPQKLMAGLLAIFAEFERDILRERVKAGIAQARQRGRRHGRPPSVTHRAVDVQHLAATGLSKSAIARRLGISRTSVRRLIGSAPVSPQSSQNRSERGDQQMGANLRLRRVKRSAYRKFSGRAPGESMSTSGQGTMLLLCTLEDAAVSQHDVTHGLQHFSAHLE